MHDKLFLCLTFLAAGVLQISLFPVVWALFARSQRVAIVKYVVGFGPAIVKRGTFELRLIPLLGSVAPASRHVEQSIPPSVADSIERGDRRYFDDLPLFVCLGTALFTLIIGFVLTSSFLGVAAAAHATASGIRDYLSAILGPFSTAPGLLDDALRVYRESTFTTALGRALGIVTAFQVLMLPSSVLGVLGMTTKGRLSAKVNVLVMTLMMLAALLWIAEIVAWLLRD